MVDSVKITGQLADGTPINLSLDGASTQRQMERLIKLTADMVDKITEGKSTLAQQEKLNKQQIANTTDLNDQLKESIDNQTKVNKETVKFEDALYDLKAVSYSLQGGFRNLFHSATTLSGAVAGLGIGLVQNLFDYSNSIGEGLKRGVAGGVMDFAISAKTAGVDMNTFTKALDESGGSFATLGNGATEGAKNFAALAGEVRHATASVGNLGMTNDEIALFTAQQTKVAVAQGYKGRQAQDLVIRNTKELGKEFDDLAARTGKNVMEMAQSAMKLAQDPLVASFIKSAGLAGKTISVEVQKLGASFKGLFGEAGDKMAGDLAKSAMSGLPFAITQSGKNMLMASSSVYSEMDRQAQLIKNGGKLEEKDKEKLRNVVMQEVAARGDQLRTMAMLDGPAGDSARAILEMATEAEKYNDADRVEARKREQTAKDFNASVRDMQANLMALAIPFLKLINGVNWTFFIDILNGFVKVVDVLLTPFTLLGQILGDTGIGTVVGGLLALVTAGSALYSGFKAIGTTVASFKSTLEKAIDGMRSITGKGALTPTNTNQDAIDRDKINRAKNQDIIDRANQAEKPKLAERASSRGSSPMDKVEALKQRRLDQAEHQKKLADYDRLQADAQKAREELKKPPVTEKPKVSDLFGLDKKVEEKKLAAQAAAQAAEEQRKARVAELYKTYRDEGKNPIDAKRAADTAATFNPKATLGEKLAKAGPLVEKFAGAITGATAAMAGAGLAIWGESRLREDANDSLGQFLVFTGKTMEIVGTFGGLLLQFYPAIQSAVGAVTAYVAANGGAMASLMAFGSSLRVMAVSMMQGVAVLGRALLAGLAPAIAGLGALAVEAFALALPFLPLIAAVTALAGIAYLVYDNWDSIVEAGKNIIDFVLTPFQLLGNGIMAIWDWLKSSWIGRKIFGGGDSASSGSSDTKTTNMASDKTQSRGNSDLLPGWDKNPETVRFTEKDGTRRPATLTEINDAKTGLLQNGSSAYPVDQSTTTSNVLPDTAAAANNQNAVKESENQRQTAKQTALLEDLVSSNSAQISIQSRTASLQDDSNKYLRTTSLASA